MGDITVKELEQRRKQLESDIQDFVNNRIEGFKRSTGYPVNDVSIYITDISIVGRDDDFFVSEVNIGVKV